MYACSCRAITEDDVRRAGRRGVIAPDDLIEVLGLNDPSCCGRCSDEVERFVALAWDGAIHLEDDVPDRPLVVASGRAVSSHGRALTPAPAVEVALRRELMAPRRGRV